jgi:hypothetical protein
MSQTDPKPTAVEVLTNLENEYNTQLRAFESAKDSYYTAQTNLFKAFQRLAVHKEHYLTSVIQQLQQRQPTQPAQPAQPARLDNIEE